ncbi:geranylgeranyl pyrophosphate synthase [Xylogone sp. PMI_703]|nr:geranylgeranyl pyrophosphate synthase [Xylogone sp. PMI_703]
MAFMDEVFVHSRLIDESEIKKTKAFTTLPVRIHERNDIADAASSSLLRDWGYYMHDGLEKKALTSPSKLGNLCAFAYSEALPERLAIVTYMTDLGLIHDDAPEAMHIHDATNEHRDFEASLDIHSTKSPQKGSRAARLKRLTAQMLVDVIHIDREMGMEMLEMYQKEWLAVVEKPDVPGFNSLDNYYKYCSGNFGLRAYWPIVEFSIGFKVPDQEKILVEHIFDPVNEALMLTTDYWSWDREYEEFQCFGHRLVNAVDVISKMKALSISHAQQVVRERMMECEKMYVERKTELFRKYPDISLNLRRWVEIAGCVISGTHYWAPSWCRATAEIRLTSGETLPDERSTEESKTSSNASRSSSSFVDTDYKSAGARLPEADSVSSVRSLNDKSNNEKNFNITSPIKQLFDAVYRGEQQRNLPVVKNHWYKPGNAAIVAPSQYICGMPSKGVRSTLIDGLDTWFQVPSESLEVVEEVVNLLHNASLLLDDIEDNSPLRRGSPAAHTIFVQKARKFSNPDAVDMLLEELEHLYLGQSWDLYWKYNLSCPTEKEYLNMIDNKTGGMFRMLLKLMQAESPSTFFSNFDHLMFLLGRFFQIRDDYMNLQSGYYSDQKGFCEDLDEGKFSYPIVYCLEHHPKFKDHIIGIFRQRPTFTNQIITPLSHESKMHIIEILKSTGTLKAVLKHLQQIEADIEAQLDRLEAVTGEKNPILRLLLIRLSMKFIQQ